MLANPQSALHTLPLHAAVHNNLYEIVELLLKRGAKIESPFYHGNSALTIACRNENFKIAKLLIDTGADVNYEHDYPLSAMCEANNYEAAAFLIENGAKPTPTKEISQPPMACAIRNKNAKIFNLLLEKGVSLDTKWAGTTFREYAYEYGDEDIINILEKRKNARILKST